MSAGLMKLNVPFLLVYRHYQKGRLRGLILLFLAVPIYLLRPLYTKLGRHKKYCPCCGWHGARFAPYISWSYVTFDTLCPVCKSHARHRGHRLYYDKIKLLEMRGLLLYFAPEANMLSYFRSSQSLQVKTSNYGVKRSKLLHESSADYNYDLMNIISEDCNWDILICHHVVEHIPDDSKGMHELYRILKPGGILIMSVPISFDLEKTIKYDRPNPLEHDHYYRYGKDFDQRIPKAFNVQTISFTVFFDSQQFEAMSLHEDYIFICRKPGEAI